MKAQGFEQLARAYNETEPRDEGGRWTTGGGAGVNVAVGSEDNDKDRIERERRLRGEETPKDAIEHGRGIPLVPEGPLAPPAPSSGALEPGPKPSDFIGEDYGKLGVGVEKPEIELGELSDHASEERVDREESMAAIRDTVSDPLMVLQQSDGRFMFLSDKAVVVLDPSGRVITTYPASHFDARIRGILDHVYRGGK